MEKARPVRGQGQNPKKSIDHFLPLNCQAREKPTKLSEHAGGGRNAVRECRGAARLSTTTTVMKYRGFPSKTEMPLRERK